MKLGNDSDCNETFSAKQKNDLLLGVGVTGTCSALCCINALAMVVYLRLYKLFVYRLATYQVMGSLLQASAMASVLLLWDYDSNHNRLYYKVSCKFSAVILQYGMWVKLMFTIQLTFHLFCYVVFFKNFKHLEKLYLALSVAFPLLMAGIPFIGDYYRIAGAWCYISSWEGDCATTKLKTGIIEQFVLYYGPATFLLALNVLAIFIMIVVLLYRAHKYRSSDCESLLAGRDQRKEILKQLLPLIVYPIIYFTFLLFPLANRIFMAASKTTNYDLIMVHALTIPSVGFFAGLALIAHICFYQIKKRSMSSKPLPAPVPGSSFSTFDDATPFTSGALTKFSLPNESEVEASYTKRTNKTKLGI